MPICVGWALASNEGLKRLEAASHAVAQVYVGMALSPNECINGSSMRCSDAMPSLYCSTHLNSKEKAERVLAPIRLRAYGHHP